MRVLNLFEVPSVGLRGFDLRNKNEAENSPLQGI